MPKRRNQPTLQTAAAPPADVSAVTRSPTREIDILAAVAAVICVVFCYLSTGALNPDGVSYLDLATAIQHGDWTHFVQGYWSPLLPFIIGATGYVAGLGGPQLIAVAHVLNLIVALGALVVIWRWARRSTAPLFGRVAITAYMLCSAGLPRIEAVTPDVLLLAITVWLSYELLANRGTRWLVVGALLGLAFLAKTSAWPWLVIGVPLRLWAAGSTAARWRAWGSTLVCAAVMLIWVVPMTIKYGHPTLGSSGRLNYSWYIRANSSRLPDTDRGRNLAYQSVPVGEGRLVTVATFDDAAHWTYQPWGDPTAWEQKVVTQTGHMPTALQIIGYWLRLASLIVGLWFGPLIVAVLLPAWILLRRPGMTAELINTQRNALAVMLLGALGVLQFAVVHAEPRLIAPFGVMLALGLITWWSAAPAPRLASGGSMVQRGLAWIGVVAALGFAVFRVGEGVSSYARLRGVTKQLDDLRARLISAGQPNVPLAIVGPAAPVLASAYWIGARIVMQVPPNYADLIATLPAEQQSQMLTTLFSGKVPLVWQTYANGGMRILLVPPRQ
jgi:hypothetical protein